MVGTRPPNCEKHIRHCICEHYQGRTLLPPQSPDLSAFRLCTDYAFANVGLDHAGPLFVKNIYGTSMEMHKSYILLLTCSTCRTIRLELVPDVSGPARVRGLRRFIGRKGTSYFVVSDNFESCKSLELRQFLWSKSINWDFILPASPWWGGFYERLVCVVKNTLRKILGSTRLTFEELTTILIEVESVINSRPLTYISDDDTVEALTPYHLSFRLNINNRVKVSNDAEVELNSEQCSERVKTLQLTLNQFWNMFRTEYLGQLREEHGYVKGKFNNDCNIEVRYLVLIKEDKFVPRGQWRKGRVENIIQEKDGMIQGASLRVYLKDGKNIILKRPVQRLVLFEIQVAVKHEKK